MFKAMVVDACRVLLHGDLVELRVAAKRRSVGSEIHLEGDK